MITFERDSAWVTVRTGETTTEVRVVETGLSDAITIEITAGLEIGDVVLEKPVKDIR